MKFEKTKIYGVKGINTTTLTRTDDAVGLTYTVESNGDVYSDFDSCYPWCDMQELVVNGADVFIKIPKFYSKVTKFEDGTYQYQISGCRYEGFSTLFIDGDGNELDYVLVGKFLGASIDGTADAGLTSRSSTGTATLTNVLGNYYDIARACENSGAGYQLYDILIDAILKQLMVVEFCSTNINKFLSSNSGAPAEPGVLTSYATGVHTFSREGVGCVYRGIEHALLSTGIWCAGLLFNNDNVFLCTNPKMYANSSLNTFLYHASGKDYFRFIGTRRVYSVSYGSSVKHSVIMPHISLVDSISTNPDVMLAEPFGNKAPVYTYSNGLHLRRINLFGEGDEGQQGTTTAHGRLCYKPI